MKLMIRIPKTVPAILIFLFLSLFLDAQNKYYNAGGPQYISLAGDTFVSDLYYTPGMTSTYTNPTANLDILNTDDDILFRSERNASVNLGSFGYDIPVVNGYFKVTLYFAEIYFGAPGGNNNNPPHNGKRVFDVSIEGILKLDNYDIFAEVGAITASVKQFDSIAISDGILDLDFAAVVNKPKISGLSLEYIGPLPNNPGNTPPTFSISISENINVSEDFAGTQTVMVTPDPVPPTEAGQVVTYSLSPSSVSFANVSINSSTGQVSITSVANGNGSQQFTITANDGQVSNNTATQNFTLTVNAVNDAPAFTLNKSSVVLTKNFVTTEYVNVIPGEVPGDESGQSVTYSLNPSSVTFANVSINTATGEVSITSVENGIGSQLFTITANDGQSENNTATQSFTLTVNDVGTQHALHINCGGPQYITATNDTFKADVYFSSGTFTSTNNLITDILNTNNDALFRTERYASNFSYNIPVENGSYTVELHFAEIFFGATGGNNTPPFNGKRVFDVSIEGTLVLDNYDIYVAAGGAERAITQQFTNVSIGDGQLNINFAASVNNAKISAISIIPSGPSDLPPTVSIITPSEGENYLEGADIQINATATDDVSVTNVEFYEGDNLLGADNTSPYSFNWNNVPPGNYSLTAKAYDSFGHITTSSAVNISVLSDLPPTVSISNPSEGSSFYSPASITINANASDDVGIINVEFYEGNNLLGSDNSSPFSFNWNNVSNGNYLLTAKAYDTNGASTTSDPVTISVTNPPAGTQTALFVVGTIPLNNGDQGVLNRLQALGFTVTTVLGSSSTTTDANGKNLVLISATVLSSTVTNKFTNVAVPVICWEHALFDDLGMTSGTSGNSGSTTSGITQLNITGAGHPLAAGLPNGLAPVYTSVQTGTWGKPNANSIKIATISGSTTQIGIFGYESGSAMVTGNAPARRVGFFLHDTGAAFLTTEGTALLDAAITWAASSSPPPANTPPTVSIINPANGAFFSAPANITVDANASDPDLGGSVSKVEFYEGASLLGTDSSAPFSFNWTHVAAGSYSLTAKAFDNLNASSTSAVISITVNPASNNPPVISLVIPANGASFSAPANVTIAANAYDPDLGGSISRVEFYEGVNLLNTDFATPYTFNWLNVPEGNYLITAKAYDNLNASTTSSASSIAVIAPTNTPPSVSITTPPNGATFTAPASITIDVNASDPDAGGSISKVEFYNGAILLDTDNSSPFSFNWTNVPAGNYSITAKAFDNLNASNTSTAVDITVNNPSVQGTILLIVGNLSLNNGDNAIKTRLEALGYSVDVKLASASVTADATGKVLVWISSTVTSGHVGSKFTNAAVPIINCEQALLDDLKMVSSTTGNAGTFTNQTQLNIIGAGHPLAAGLPNGLATVCSPGQTVSWGVPGVNALKIASYAGNIMNAVIFGYESGVTMVGLNAPAKRLGFFLENSTAAYLNANGLALFDAAINWALSTSPSNTPPSVNIVNPANGTTFTAPANINISASAIDTDGSVTMVEFYNGNTLLGSDNSSPFSFNWNAVTAGTYSITAIAFDNLNASTTSAPVSITVNTNNPPSVSITSPANGTTFMAPANITINATASDTDGSITLVEFYNGLTLLGSDNTSPFSFNWNSVAAGNYSITAKAFDNLNASTISTAVNITVNSNNPPTVSITSPANGATFIAPTNITISANASDTDGSITLVEFYNGLTLLGSDNTSPFSFDWNNIAAGNYSITAKAFDNLNGSTTSAAVNITVNANSPPSVSITNPANGATFTAPANISISANASDADGSITIVEFYNGAILLTTDNSSPYTYNWTNLPVGNYTLTAKAYDNLNASATSAAVNITVDPAPNNPPVVSITNPTSGSVFLPPASFTINVSASDPDVGGSIAKVEFYQGITLMGTDYTSPYSLSLSGVPAGNYQFTAKAFDNLNASTTSASINVYVNLNGNIPPAVTISSPSNGAIFTTPTNVTITAEAYDPDGGGISKVEFYQGGIKLGTALSLPYSFTWNNVPAGSYQLTAKAFDNLNASTTSAVVNIVVNNPTFNTALFVVGNTTLNNGDAAVKNKLESMGYTVTTISDAASTSTDATGKTMVLISSTVAASNINTKFTNVSVPVITWEASILDDLKMTGTASTEFGSTYNKTQINIIGAGHPLAAGLPNGLTQVVGSVQTMTWGKPNANAAVIATASDNPALICLFGYSTGTSMFGINAPAHRVALFLSDNAPAALNAAGMSLLEAAINWAAGSAKNDAENLITKQQEDEISITAYPNPNNGIFYLKIDNIGNEKLSIRIFNYWGQSVAIYENEAYFGYNEKYDLSFVPAGMYFIQAQAGEKLLTSRIFVNGR